MKEALIVIATVLIWRGLWSVCNDIEAKCIWKDYPMYRGAIFTGVGAVMLWILVVKLQDKSNPEISSVI